MTEFPRSILDFGPDDDLDVIAEISATLDILKPKKPDDEAVDIFTRGQQEQDSYKTTQKVIESVEEQVKPFVLAAILDAQGLLERLGDEDTATQIVGAEVYEKLQKMAHDQEQQRKLD
jgi:hypothetical protein